MRYKNFTLIRFLSVFRPVACLILSLNIAFGGTASEHARPKTDAGHGAPAVAGCTPYSTLACTALKVSLPFTLNFQSAVSGTIVDKNGKGTGFTAVNNYSGTRNPADGTPSVPSVPGYEPSKLSVENGTLVIVANKGIDFQTTNNLLNLLTVRIPVIKRVQMDVKVINPFQATASQQAGIWFGLNDKTYIKLSIANSQVELRKEKNNLTSVVAGTQNPDQRVTDPISGISTKTVRLRMVLDFNTNIVEGYYSLDGVKYINVGAKYNISGLNVSGMALNDANALAGLYATYRNASNPAAYTFDDFSIKDVSSQASAFQPVSVNFRPSGSAPPAGFIADNGLPASSTRTFGWISPGTFQPVNMSGNMRLRTGTRDPKELPFVQMQAVAANEVSGTWEYKVPNGQYTVTVSAGDNAYINSNHQINVEGLPAISDFVPTMDDKFRAGTVTVQVSDGKLTIDAKGGDNSKMNYATIRTTAPVTDATAPTASARLVGVTQSANAYKDQVQIFLKAGDQGGSGLKTFQYSINNGAYINYTVPFFITNDGSYSLKVKAVDGNNNQTITNAYNFTVGTPPVTKKLTFSQSGLSFTILKGNAVQSQTVTLTASPAASYTLAKTEAAWLVLPSPTGTLTFGSQNIKSNIEPGKYQALVTASAPGYEPAKLLIDFLVVEPIIPTAVKVNFQDTATVPPLNYIKDYGQGFGLRTDVNQGVGNVYGWKRRSDGAVMDLAGNGANRNTPEDVLLATLVHMQADDIPTAFQGVKTEGYWEMKVPNGKYSATVSVGDAFVNTSPEIHTLNVEGVKAIDSFVPNGKKGTISRFKTNTVEVNVTDERLTINADGGTNTKITFANIAPISLSPYLYWSGKTRNLIIQRGTTENKTFTMLLGRSDNATGNYTLTASYGAGASGWLSFSSTASGVLPKILFNFSAAKNLPVGIYKAVVRAASGSTTSAELNVQINVVDGSRPYVVSSNPLNGEANVSLSTAAVAANDLSVPAVSGVSGGVDNSTIDSTTVMLYKIVNGVSVKVAGSVQGSIGGDVISFTPANGLEATSTYRFVVTPGVKSHAGAAFAPYEANFTTAAGKIDSTNILDARFDKIPIPNTQDKKYTSLTIGPDGKFYALRLDGVIERFTINHTTGMLSELKTINTLVTKYGARSAIGLVFDPQSTATNLTAWVSHSSAGLSSAPAFDGNVSRLKGDSLQTEQLMITKLPRSRRDHLINSLAFGPDGALYMCQGSMSSAGSYDDDWQRDESLLSGTILRLDLAKLTGTLPLVVQTTFDQNLINTAPANALTLSDGTYNPYASAAPLTIYASGVRNAYDLLWHSNGQLYVPTNGSGGGGNSPASVAGTRKVDGTFYNGPEVPQSNSIQAQYDWLFRMNPSKSVGYFGHPNPLRGEYVLNRGFKDNRLYLPSVVPDQNYRPGYNFGLNNSPNGVIEYKSSTFKGVLKNKILVVRFSGGGDIMVMQPGSLTKNSNPASDTIYDIVRVTTGSGNNGLVGMSGFGNPLDIVEDTQNGNLYVAEYNWNDSPNLIPQITLLKVAATPAARLMSLTATSEPMPEDAGARKYEVTISNPGEDTLEVKDIRLTGDGISGLQLDNILLPNSKEPLRIPKDSSVHFQVYASRFSGRPASGKLVVTSVDNTVKEMKISAIGETEIVKMQEEKEEEGEGHNLRVYPNPSLGGTVQLRLDKFNKQEPVTIYVYDLKGNLVKSISATADSNGTFGCEVADRRSRTGVYIIRVVYLSGDKVARIVHTF